ncbi:MAG: TSUP family transporter [Pseudomonadota bacterium]
MEALDLSITVLLMLCLAAMAAGYLDTLVGGGGLITIPALLIAGVPPIFALGTNKLQAVVGTATASAMMISRRKVRFEQVSMMMLVAFIGSLLGALAVQYVDSQALSIMIPVVIVGIAVYFVVAPKQTLEAREPRISPAAYNASAVPGIGFYDGMFGPGTGSFFVLAGVSLRGQGVVDATAIAKPLNFATNLASLLVFVVFGKLLWLIGGVMMVGQIIGANLGARTLLTINPVVLRYLIIGVCFVMLISWTLTSATG